MSSKNAENTARYTSQTPLRTWSITGRLTLHYALSAFAMLLLTSAVLYWALASNLEKEDQQSLAGKVHVLRVILREHGDDPVLLEQEIKLEGFGAQDAPYNAYYARILDAVGSVMQETPGMGSAVPRSAFSPVIQDRIEEGMRWKRDGHFYLLMSAWAVAGRGADPNRVIQLALDVTRENLLLADYRRKLAAVLMLGVVLSAAIGGGVARRSMRPLREITRAAQRITASQLSERIDPARWPVELTALAQAFDQMLARLDGSFTRLSQFSADLAHELRTPINNLVGEAEVALSRVRAPDDYRQVVESSLEEYDRMARMIESLLFLARAENAQTHVEKARRDARLELEAVREFYAALTQERGSTVTCHGDAVVEADPILLRRALSNLLCNALRYTPSGGQITLAAKRLEATIEIRVSDTGSGIAPEHLPKIFDRFYRADAACPHDTEGAGLGLAIVKSIMTLHGGEVSVESTFGRGTVFTLMFPSPPKS